jgi:hypothetical protein
MIRKSSSARANQSSIDRSGSWDSRTGLGRSRVDLRATTCVADDGVQLCAAGMKVVELHLHDDVVVAVGARLAASPAAKQNDARWLHMLDECSRNLVEKVIGRRGALNHRERYARRCALDNIV